MSASTDEAAAAARPRLLARSSPLDPSERLLLRAGGNLSLFLLSSSSSENMMMEGRVASEEAGVAAVEAVRLLSSRRDTVSNPKPGKDTLASPPSRFSAVKSETLRWPRLARSSSLEKADEMKLKQKWF